MVNMEGMDIAPHVHHGKEETALPVVNIDQEQQMEVIRRYRSSKGRGEGRYSMARGGGDRGRRHSRGHGGRERRGVHGKVRAEDGQESPRFQGDGGSDGGGSSKCSASQEDASIGYWKSGRRGEMEGDGLHGRRGQAVQVAIGRATGQRVNTKGLGEGWLQKT